MVQVQCILEILGGHYHLRHFIVQSTIAHSKTTELHQVDVHTSSHPLMDSVRILSKLRSAFSIITQPLKLVELLIYHRTIPTRVDNTMIQ